jgi:PPK2 family polyphosphate:nucleotide phosphotransferase
MRAVVDEKPARKVTAEVKDDAGVSKQLSRVLEFGRGDKLADIDPSSTPGFKGGRSDGEEALAECSARLGELQERLFAESKGGGKRSVLLVIQGMDTSGKGGILEHVVGAVDPQGVKITSFKAPTAEERAHDFLWRIGNALPGPGEIGVFDRSHYEDVLIVRVRNLVPQTEWKTRYASINAFERRAANAGTKIVKVMLHISKDEQKTRLLARLDNPAKHWKYRPGDVDERQLWDDYQEAYQVALARCSTKAAPWHVVPADNKWYARLAVQQLLLEALTEMDPVWPAASFDVEVEKERVAQS